MLTQQNAFSVQFFPGMLQIAKEHQLAGQQHDNLCGPYWGAILLRSRGFSTTSEQLAHVAGSVLPVGEPSNWVPRGATPRQDYGLPLPAASRTEDGGTSAQGLIEAVAQAAAGAYCLLPLKADWSAERVETAIALCQNHPDWNAVPLCNIKTGHLWGSRLDLLTAIAYLNGQEMMPPPADWDVGHFVALAGTVVGAERSLVMICDNYPIFGWQGYYLQSAEAIAQALNRDDGHEGGILLFLATDDKQQAEQQATAQGFLIGAWDNGSPTG